MRRRGVVAAAVVAVLGLVAITGLQATDAAWTDRVMTRGTVTAATISQPLDLRCSAGLLQPAVFSWTPPSTGPAPIGYRWSVTGGLSGGATLPASARSVSLNAGLLGLGSGTFSLVTVGPGGWESQPVTGRVSITRVVVDVLTSCSLP